MMVDISQYNCLLFMDEKCACNTSWLFVIDT